MNTDSRRTDLLKTIRRRERAEAADHLGKLRDREDDLARDLLEVRSSIEEVEQTLRAATTSTLVLAAELEIIALHTERTRGKLAALTARARGLSEELLGVRELICDVTRSVVEADVALKILDEA